jgi:iron complex transport system permease protein
LKFEVKKVGSRKLIAGGFLKNQQEIMRYRASKILHSLFVLRSNQSQRLWVFSTCLALGLVILLFFMNLMFGSVSIPFSATFDILTGQSTNNTIFENIVMRTRLPQAIVALTAGIALGMSGLMLQTLFHNPLAGPSVLGISSGASLGAALVVLISGQSLGISLSEMSGWGDAAIIAASLGGALATLLLILAVSQRVNGTLSVLIIGVMIGYLTNSVVGVLKYFSKETDVHSYVIWGLGSFNRLSLDRAMIFAIITLVPSALALLLSKPLNLISLGDRYAQNLGLKTSKARFSIIMMSGVLTAMVTAFCGPIAFIGMAVPHLAKLTTRTSNHLILLTSTALWGAGTSLVCNMVSRLPGLESSLPINAVTAFVGAPVVIWVILKKKLKV